MSIQRRLAKLTARHSEPANGPSVIYLSGPDDDPRAALIIGGGSIQRGPAESAAAFQARARLAAGHGKA
jgi:hypothetical protein